MDEDVASTDFAEQDSLGGVIEKADEIPGSSVAHDENEAKQAMLNHDETTSLQCYNNCCKQSSD